MDEKLARLTDDEMSDEELLLRTTVASAVTEKGEEEEEEEEVPQGKVKPFQSQSVINTQFLLT